MQHLAIACVFFSIDGSENSRIARYINDAPKRHANCLPKAVMLEGKPRLLFFATKDIDPYTELRYDYGGKNLPWQKVSYHTYYIFGIHVFSFGTANVFIR